MESFPAGADTDDRACCHQRRFSYNIRRPYATTNHRAGHGAHNCAAYHASF